MGLTLAEKVSVETSTSSPGPTPARISARWRAAVPELSANAYGAPTAAATSASNASTCGPSGAIQLDAKVSWTNCCSRPDMWGGER